MASIFMPHFATITPLEVSVGLEQDMFWCNGEPVLVVGYLGHPQTRALQVLEHFFVIIFALELVYRVYKVRWEYFRDGWNLLDAALVVVAVLDLYILEPLLSSTPTSNAVAFRVFRVIKLALGRKKSLKGEMNLDGVRMF